MFLTQKTNKFYLIFTAVVVLSGCAHISSPRAAKKAGQPDVPIVLYHHVGNLPDNAGRAQRRWTISLEKFDQQMSSIAEQGFHPVTMAQLSDSLKSGSPLPNKPIVISFDDGWKDQYSAALPILKKYKFPATFFIITDSVGHSAYMDWDEVLKLSAAGMDIQPHSRTHSRLSVLSNDQARQEIIGSKKDLEEHLCKETTVFSYPYGSYDDDIISLVKEAGFDMAVTVNGLNNGYYFRADRSYAFSRYAVEGEDDLEDIAPLREGKGVVCSALFISLVQDPQIFSSREGVDALIDYASGSGIKTLFVQVYRENKAWFPSKTADPSPYYKFRDELSEDLFARIIRLAHEQGIQVHAWLNLLSLAQNQDSVFLKKYGPDILTRNLKEKKCINDYLIDEQYFLEPGDQRVRDDLSKIVEELVRAYPGLDGIQYDYIRYPDMDPHYGYTRNNIARYKKATGAQTIDEESLAWKEWKRVQVTELLNILSKTARCVNPDIQVSATGCMPYTRALEEAFQDWPSWISSGLIDFVTIMDYSSDPDEFKRWLAVVKEKVPDLEKVRIGVGAYKLTRSPDKFEEEIRGVEELGLTAAVFHYGNILRNPRLKSVIARKNDR